MVPRARRHPRFAWLEVGRLLTELVARRRHLPVGLLCLACLFVLGLVLRLWGIAFGLPYVYTFDEQTSIGEALGLIHGTPDVLSFANPPLYKYALVAVFSTLDGVQDLAPVDRSQLYLIARAASAVFGALLVLAVYWLGRLVRGPQAGLIAAGIAAVTYLLVRESHFGVNDALAALCTTLGLACSVRVACRGTRADYLAAHWLADALAGVSGYCSSAATPGLAAAGRREFAGMSVRDYGQLAHVRRSLHAAGIVRAGCPNGGAH